MVSIVRADDQNYKIPSNNNAIKLFQIIYEKVKTNSSDVSSQKVNTEIYINSELTLRLTNASSITRKISDGITDITIKKKDNTTNNLTRNIKMQKDTCSTNDDIFDHISTQKQHLKHCRMQTEGDTTLSSLPIFTF